jgi:hypothetical protein
MIKHGRQMFKVAMRKGLIQSNPFADIKGGSQRNDARLHFVGRDVIAKALEFCNPDWKAILALCRYGALRCPSEVLTLKWEHIDWEGGKVLVQSPKGENHGKPVRPLPLFPELREILWEVHEAAPVGAVFVVHGYRDASNANLRTQFLRILARAKLPRWERLFHNLRSSRIVELSDRYPLKTVCEWAGHTPDVAMSHYLSSTAEHFERALTERTDAGKRAVQNAAYQEVSLAVTGSQQPRAECDELRRMPTDNTQYQLVTSSQAPRAQHSSNKFSVFSLMETPQFTAKDEFASFSVGRFANATGIEPNTLWLTPRPLKLLTGRSIWGVAKNYTSPVNSRVLIYSSLGNL